MSFAHSILILLLAPHVLSNGRHDFCPAPSVPDSCSGTKEQLQFLLYSVRRGEGFNLARDVYMRMIEVQFQLRKNGLNVTLVLPEWGPLPHWNDDRVNSGLKWSEFFDTDSMNYLTPVMEQSDFETTVSPEADLELSLSHFPDTFSGTSEWTERLQVRECSDSAEMDSSSNSHETDCPCSGRRARLMKCLFVDGTSKTLADALERDFKEHKSILISNADVVLHHEYGSAFFWQIRRSMRFSETLIQAGNEFRSQFLHSNDQKDRTEIPSDWRQMRRMDGDATGGEYLSLHWRRGDFALIRPDVVPSIQCTADQITRLTARLRLRRLFLATDASPHEIQQLLLLFHESQIEVHIYDKDRSDPRPVGQKAIIDQWICAHGRYFVGESLLFR